LQPGVHALIALALMQILHKREKLLITRGSKTLDRLKRLSSEASKKIINIDEENSSYAALTHKQQQHPFLL